MATVPAGKQFPLVRPYDYLCHQLLPPGERVCPMKVLFLTLWYPNRQNPVSGTFVHEQAKSLREAGCDVRVMQPLPMTPFPLPLFKKSYRELACVPDEEDDAGQPVYHPRYLTLPGHSLFERVGDWMFQAIQNRLAAIYQDWRFDIIHAHSTYPCGYVANRCRDEMFPHVKVVHTIHRTCIVDAPNYNRACFRKVRDSLDGADFNVFVSGEGMRLGHEYTQDRISAFSQYITNGVNTETFSLSDAERQEVDELKSTHAKSWNLVFVGYLKEIKGIKELLEATKNLVAQGQKNLRLFLVGENQLGSYVDDYVAASGLQDVVVRVGAVPHQRVKIWMRFASAFILPSHSEGTPTVLFEALFVGVPSIFTHVGGVGDIVMDRQEALLIPPRSVAAIEKAIAILMRDPLLCRELAGRGHELISGKFTWTLNAQAHQQVYQRLLGIGAAGQRDSEPA
ncbi:MAG: glycosyltransferase [Gammaproteobacteria bacterium]|nr:glycosyltransferase [Gammaproteobacteria bacterium]MBU4169752.1 glycosyltransferase [Gammaproteobacteria bacterium]